MFEGDVPPKRGVADVAGGRGDVRGAEGDAPAPREVAGVGNKRGDDNGIDSRDEGSADAKDDADNPAGVVAVRERLEI